MNTNNNSERLRRSPLVVAGVCIAFSGVAWSQSLPLEFVDVWSGSFTTQNDEFWEIEDHTVCVAGCSPGTRKYMAALLDDPANDERSIRELAGEATAFARAELASKSTPKGLAIQEANTPANDTVLDCKPYGLVREATNPFVMAIHHRGEHVEFEYEEWDLRRTIYMDERDHPLNLEPSPLGHSIGGMEGDVLVVESVGAEDEIYFAFQAGGGHSAEATVTERYEVLNDPKRLTLELTVTDPVTLNEPHVIEKFWLSTPDVELVEDSCADRPGVF